MLRLVNINLNLGSGLSKRSILQNLNLEITKGEFVVIIGANGAGKSTILSIISGAVVPDSGEVFIDGINVTKVRNRARLVSQVVQDPRIGTMDDMTIFENMAFASARGSARGLSLFDNAERRQYCHDKLTALNMGLESRMDDMVSELSGGQRQVISLVMATLADAKVFLLDEITAALDPKVAGEVMHFADHIVRANGYTCIMVTHNMAHAIKYGTRLLVLNDGKIMKEYSGDAKYSLTPAHLVSSNFGL